MNPRIGKSVIVAGFTGWLGCFGVMGMAMASMSLDNALLVHAIAAPVIFAAVSVVYFTRFADRDTSLLVVATVFVGLVMSMDFLLVALIINRSLDMFASLIGTWIPFGLIFASTYATGTLVRGRGLRSKATAATRA